MKWRISEDGKRVIGFRVPDDPPEVVGTFELEEPSVVVETSALADAELVLRMADDRRADELLVHAGSVMTAKALVDAAHDLWIVCRVLAREAGSTVPELLKLVGMCDKENRRRGQAKRRLEVRAADMVE